ncbi:MAG: nucleotide exchange factor GrpE [Acidiferrobacteraceae bacterium]
MSRKKSPDHVPEQEPSMDPTSEIQEEATTEPEADRVFGSPRIEELERQLKAAKAETAEHYERFLRAKAETENIRRRAETDIANIRKFAIDAFAADVLTVRDSLERAQAIDISDEGIVSKVIEGLALTLRQVDAVLERFGLIPINPVGERFDPERHQAMSIAETQEIPPGHVLQVAQKGYLLNGRLLRPAMVIVAKEAVKS